VVRRRLQRTLVASEAFSLTDRFDAFFSQDRISGYVPRLVEPPDTTGGGKQAVQHICLQAADVPGPPLTAGWVNWPSRQAKLRTLGCMQAILTHRRSGSRVRLDSKSYQQFFERCWRFLETQGVTPSAEHEPPELSAGATGRGIPGWLWGLAALLVIALILLGVLLVTGRAGFGRG
jgi:hypothetical protein